MTTTITIQDSNININGVSIEDLLLKVYEQGNKDGSDLQQKISFKNLSKELAAKGRIVSPRTLAVKAKNANVQIFPFDGKNLAVFRKDIGKFLNIS